MALFCQGIDKLILYVTKINPIFKNIRSIYLTALDWLRQEELQEVPLKNGYCQTDI